MRIPLPAGLSLRVPDVHRTVPWGEEIVRVGGVVQENEALETGFHVVVQGAPPPHNPSLTL